MRSPDYRILLASVAHSNQRDLRWAVVDPVWPDEETLDELEHISTATAGQRAVYTTMLFAREVDNGGLRQFLHNSSSLYSQHVLDGLSVLGATDMHEALSFSLALFPDGKPSPSQVRRKQILQALSAEQQKALEVYEKAIYSTGGFEEGLVPLWSRYIWAHPDEFFLDSPLLPSTEGAASA